MSNKKDGGPAFPAYADLGSRENYASGKTVEQGMSLRDYFAAKAMQAVWSGQEQSYPGPYPPDEEKLEQWRTESLERAAIWSYRQADAMLKAREQ